MSGTVPGSPGVPGPGRGIPVTPRASTTSPIPVTTIGTGMIAPSNPFVDPTGQLTGLSFRFLFEVWTAVNNLQTAVNTINQRLTNAGIP